jgi:hypothetical protein
MPLKSQLKISILIIIICFLVLFVWSDLSPFEKIRRPDVNINLPAFPGAQGFGTETPGGRFGKIIFVTNLNDTTNIHSPEYTGSFRWALEHTWADDPDDPFDQRRIVIFRVGGTIELVASLVLKQPYVTIAGQTAPGDGLLLRGEEFTIATHDVIVRNVRVRVGDKGIPTCCRDGIGISTYFADSDAYNVVIDHSSVSWAIDENLSTWTEPTKPFTTHDVTIQWSIVGEGLEDSIHVDEDSDNGVTDPHSMGMYLGENGHNITIHHNLMAHNSGRNPLISGIVNSEIINNVVYDWGYAAFEFNSKKNITHLLGNYFKAGVDSMGPEVSIRDPIHLESQAYLDGNLGDNPRVSDVVFESRVNKPEDFLISEKLLFQPSGIGISPALIAYVDVLDYAGATSPARDAVDARIVDQVRNRSGRIIDSQNQVGGWPVYQSGQYPNDSDHDGIPDNWELEHGLDPNSSTDANSPSELAPSGYSWIEEYINSLLYIPDISP